ncbi:hypothetical protein Tco_0807621 [Tanacetum coccineum]
MIVVVHFIVCNNDSPIFVRYHYLYGNPDIGTTVGFQKTLLACPDVLTLDKPYYQMENLSVIFIHESNPDDAGAIFILYNGPQGTKVLADCDYHTIAEWTLEIHASSLIPKGFSRGTRPLIASMLLVASTNPNAGQEHDAVTQTQPSSSTPPVPSQSSPPVQSPPQSLQSTPTLHLFQKLEEPAHLNTEIKT